MAPLHRQRSELLPAAPAATVAERPFLVTPTIQVPGQRMAYTRMSPSFIGAPTGYRSVARNQPGARLRTIQDYSGGIQMTDAGARSPADVVDFLVGQHEQIKSLFEQTLSASGKQRENAFLELRRLLAVHETAEEEIVHPRAKRKLPNGDKVVGARLEEEHEAKTVLAKLENLDVDTDEFTRQLSELRDAVIDHAEHEEHDEFAKLEKELSSDELERMGRAAKLAESLAPTRPHAGVESQVANLFAGPFAAMMDRARDAILGKG
jgi:hemerythrin superfamily protein